LPSCCGRSNADWTVLGGIVDKIADADANA